MCRLHQVIIDSDPFCKYIMDCLYFFTLVENELLLLYLLNMFYLLKYLSCDRSTCCRIIYLLLAKLFRYDLKLMVVYVVEIT